MSDVDSQTAALLRRLAESPDDGSPPDPAALRAPWPADDPALLAPRALPAVTDLLLPGEPPVPIRLYLPPGPAPRPALVWLHPGGFVAGRIDDIDGVCRTLAADSGCAVIAVDYRLAPEDPFPCALDDVMRVLRWLGRHGRAVGVDPGAVAVGGQSAGATLAAACAWQLRDEAVRPALQVLAYPVLDPRLDAPSYVENGEGFHFTTAGLRWCWEQYLGEGAGDPPREATPLYADDVRRVAPALIHCAGRDPARDDSRRYAAKLRADGVPTELVEYPRTIHAFLSFAGVLDVAKEALALIAGRLRERLGGGRPWLQHVTLPYPPGAEDAVRRFYGERLGLAPTPVPAGFAGRGFMWFAAGPAGEELHLVPEQESARHACFAVADIDEAIRRSGQPVERFDLLPGRPQAFLRDPAGNLVELTSLPS